MNITSAGLIISGSSVSTKYEIFQDFSLSDGESLHFLYLSSYPI